jgi:hypothetical protein
MKKSARGAFKIRKPASRRQTSSPSQAASLRKTRNYTLLHILLAKTAANARVGTAVASLGPTVDKSAGQDNARRRCNAGNITEFSKNKIEA